MDIWFAEHFPKMMRENMWKWIRTRVSWTYERAIVKRIASGDEVVTTGGVLGRITEVGDTFITLEIADGVRVKVQKTQVTQLMPKGTMKSA